MSSVRLTTPSSPDTSQIQAALDGYDEVALGPGAWESGPLTSKTNNSFDIESGATLTAISAEFGDPTVGLNKYKVLFKARDVSGVRVTGAGSMIVPADEVYTESALLPLGARRQYRHCIRFGASQNGTVDGTLTLTSRCGDGVSMGAARYETPTIDDPCTNISITGVTADNCYRAGIVVAHVDGLTVDGCELKNSEGIAAEGGLAMEPNRTVLPRVEYLKNVVIRNCNIHDNTGYGVQVQMYHTPAEVDITISDCVIKCGSGAGTAGLMLAHGLAAGDVASIVLKNSQLYAHGRAAIRCHNFARATLLVRGCALYRTSVPASGDVQLQWNDSWPEITPFTAADFGTVTFRNTYGPSAMSVVLQENALPQVTGAIWRTGSRAQVGESGLYLDEPDDPFRQIHDTLWYLLEQHSGFTALVPAGNRIKHAEGFEDADRDRDPGKRAGMSADYPEVRIVSSGGKAHQYRSSSRSSCRKDFQIQVRTGEQQTGLLFRVEWEILRAMMDWLDYIEHLEWHDNRFAKRCAVQEVSDTVTGRKGNRGWSTAWACSTELWFDSADLLPV